MEIFCRVGSFHSFVKFQSKVLENPNRLSMKIQIKREYCVCKSFDFDHVRLLYMQI